MYLFKRSKSAWQAYETTGENRHFLFAVMHGVNDDLQSNSIVNLRREQKADILLFPTVVHRSTRNHKMNSTYLSSRSCSCGFIQHIILIFLAFSARAHHGPRHYCNDPVTFSERCGGYDAHESICPSTVNEGPIGRCKGLANSYLFHHQCQRVADQFVRWTYTAQHAEMPSVCLGKTRKRRQLRWTLTRILTRLTSNVKFV